MNSEDANDKNSETAEQVSAREALERMRKFVERKDKFVDAVKAGKNRSVPTGEKG